MGKLKQNDLATGTTEMSFVSVVNENLSEDEKVALIKEIEYIDPETEESVIVNLEGISPVKMKEILDRNQGKVNFKTPGENYNEEIKGVCQIYNEDENIEEIP